MFKPNFMNSICKHEIGTLPYISDLCNSTNWTQTIINVRPSLNASIELAEYISQTNFDIITNITNARKSLFELTTLIERSHIEPNAKDDLRKGIDKTTDEAVLATRGIHRMFSKFAVVLDATVDYAKRMHRRLTQERSFLFRWFESNRTTLKIDCQSFAEDLKNLEKEIGIVMEDTIKVYGMLGMCYLIE